MAVQSDRWIRRMALEHRMIDPFVEAQKRDGRISYGLSSYGYDMRVSGHFQVGTLEAAAVMDPKQPRPATFVDVQTDDYAEIPPHALALARSVEYFRIPRDVLAVAFGKSTYARCGLVVNVTPFEPEWEGFVTLSLSNTSPWPVRVYAHEGIAQVLFLKSEEVCAVSYADRQGKYQAQMAITHARL